MKTKLHLNALCFALVLVGISCDNLEVKPTEEYYVATPPLLNAGFPTHIEQDSILYKSIMPQLGTLGLKAYGVCYGLKENPTLADRVEYSKSPIDTLPFVFQNRLKNLKLGTTYQIRSFVITSKDTTYGINNYFRTYAKDEWTSRKVGIPVSLATTDPDLATTFSDDKKIYMLYQNENRLWEYDPTKYGWFEKKTMLSALRTKPTKYSFMLNGKGYCGNIQQTDTQLDAEFWEFDVQTNTWKNLEGNKPAIKTTKCFGFTDGKFGYVLNLSERNTWNLWRFDPIASNWLLINEGLANETVTNLFSDGTNTFIVTKSNAIHKFNAQKWEYFTDISGLFQYKGNRGYYGGVLHNKIYIGEHEDGGSLGGVRIMLTRVWKSIDISNKNVEELRGANYQTGIGVLQTKNKLFYGSKTFISPSVPISMEEYFPK